MRASFALGVSILLGLGSQLRALTIADVSTAVAQRLGAIGTFRADADIGEYV